MDASAPSMQRQGSLKSLFRRVKSALSFRGKQAIAPAPVPVVVDTNPAPVRPVTPPVAKPPANNNSMPLTPPQSAKGAHSATASPVSSQRLTPVTNPAVSSSLSPETMPAPTKAKPTTPQSLSPAEAAVAATVGEVFGEDGAVVLAAGSSWADRQAVLAAITEALAVGAARAPPGGSLALLQCMCTLVGRTAIANVSPVSWAGLELWWTFVTSEFAGRRAPAEAGAAAAAMRDVVPVFLVLMNRKNARTQREARRCVLSLARNKALDGIAAVGPCLLDDSLPLGPRLDILSAIIPQHRLKAGDGGLTPASVVGVAVKGLADANDRVRSTAVTVTVAVHKVVGEAITPLLVDVKVAVLKVLRAAFDANRRPGGLTSSKTLSRSSSRKLAPLPTTPITLPKLTFGPAVTGAGSHSPPPAWSRTRLFNGDEEALMNAIADNPEGEGPRFVPTF